MTNKNIAEIASEGFPGGNFHAIRKALIGRSIVNAVQLDDFKAVVTLDDGTRIELEGNEGGCCCRSGDWAITRLFKAGDAPATRIMNAHLDNQIKEDEEMGCLAGPIAIFVMMEGGEYPLVEFDGMDGSGCYGDGFWCHVTRVTPPEE